MLEIVLVKKDRERVETLGDGRDLRGRVHVTRGRGPWDLRQLLGKTTTTTTARHTQQDNKNETLSARRFIDCMSDISHGWPLTLDTPRQYDRGPHQYRVLRFHGDHALDLLAPVAIRT